MDVRQWDWQRNMLESIIKNLYYDYNRLFLLMVYLKDISSNFAYSNFSHMNLSKLGQGYFSKVC